MRQKGFSIPSGMQMVISFAPAPGSNKGGGGGQKRPGNKQPQQQQSGGGKKQQQQQSGKGNAGGGGGSITFQSGSTSVTSVSTVQLGPNMSLGNNGGGSVTIDAIGGGGVAAYIGEGCRSKSGLT